MMLQSPKHNAYHFQSNQRNSALLRWPLHRSATVARSGHRRRLHPGQLDGSLMGAARLGGSRVFKKQIYNDYGTIRTIATIATKIIVVIITIVKLG